MANDRDPRAELRVHPNGIEFTHGAIAAVVDDFYGRVQRDPRLSVPFRSVHDWPDHVARLTHFWWIRFGGKPYAFTEYNPVQKHFFAGFNEELLARWLELFHQTLREHLTPEQCGLWEMLSRRMGRHLAERNRSMILAHGGEAGNGDEG